MDGARTMRYMTDDLRIREIKELSPPAHLIREFPCDDVGLGHRAREPAGDPPHPARHGRPAAWSSSARARSTTVGGDGLRAQLKAERDRLAADLEIVMRVYFEKPRTTVGWKGLINDPDLDGSFSINQGLRLARELLLEINAARPAGRLRVSRHDHAAVHRRPRRVGRDRRAHDREPGASRAGLRPVVPGRLQERHRRQRPDRVDAIKAAQQPHHFLSVTKGGHSAIVSTKGNEDCHVILRGGKAAELRRGERRGGVRRTRRRPGSRSG